MALYSVVLFPKTHNPSLIVSKIQDKPNRGIFTKYPSSATKIVNIKTKKI